MCTILSGESRPDSSSRTKVHVNISGDRNRRHVFCRTNFTSFCMRGITHVRIISSTCNEIVIELTTKFLVNQTHAKETYTCARINCELSGTASLGIEHTCATVDLQVARKNTFADTNSPSQLERAHSKTRISSETEVHCCCACSLSLPARRSSGE